MRGVVVSHRRGRNSIHEYQAIVEVDGVTSREQASTLVGKRVVWTTPGGRKFVGKVLAPHGNKGRVRVRFAEGVPGQMIGDFVEIL
ncbi:MAG: large subunit ribosomal protein L35Ae [Candidatus Diapherotrites archaeon]|nr:large subunit ribosomal protein L35Ae [Candidatus Diapherotrites archaeon]